MEIWIKLQECLCKGYHANTMVIFKSLNIFVASSLISNTSACDFVKRVNSAVTQRFFSVRTQVVYVESLYCLPIPSTAIVSCSLSGKNATILLTTVDTCSILANIICGLCTK